MQNFFVYIAVNRGLRGLEYFRVYSVISGVVGILIILPCEFGFAIIVNVYVGDALIAFDGRCVLNTIVKVFGVAKRKKQ